MVMSSVATSNCSHREYASPKGHGMPPADHMPPPCPPPPGCPKLPQPVEASTRNWSLSRRSLRMTSALAVIPICSPKCRRRAARWRIRLARPLEEYARRIQLPLAAAAHHLLLEELSIPWEGRWRRGATRDWRCIDSASSTSFSHCMSSHLSPLTMLSSTSAPALRNLSRSSSDLRWRQSSNAMAERRQKEEGREGAGGREGGERGNELGRRGEREGGGGTRTEQAGGQ